MPNAELAEPIVTLAEARAFARIETGEEEAFLAGLIRSASCLCEAFLGQVVIERGFTETLAAGGEWQRLSIYPVRSISGLVNSGASLPASAYATDIDANGCGWIRIVDPGVEGIVEVSGTAGMAVTQNGVHEAIRHGVLRLVAYLFTSRDGDGGQIPAAVTALWRPFRRMKLA
jgi:uncharacterized phiE125 gp8 family phage protein